MAYYSSKPTTVFERLNGNEFNFKGNDVKTQKELSEKTNANRLYMPVAAEWGYKKASDAYAWFEALLDDYIELNSDKMIEIVVNSEVTKERLLTALKKADFNISDIFVRNKKMEKEQLDIIKDFITKLIPNTDIDNLSEARPEIYVTHRNIDGIEFSINLDSDSAGTKSLIKEVAELIYLDSKKEVSIVMFDELGTDYHTKLTEYFLKIVKNQLSGLQMLFCSHNTKILNMLEPEQVYLVDKDDEGATFVKLLDDYTIRENDNVELGYLKGRYGAIPYMME